MTNFRLTIAFLPAALFLPVAFAAQAGGKAAVRPASTIVSVNVAPNDSAADALRMENLRQRRAALRSQIDEEDKKRNRSIGGVAPETLERMNRRQDSICLELRSELVTVELEMNEISASAAPIDLADLLPKQNENSLRSIETQQKKEE